MSQTLRFSLALSARDFQRFYAGTARQVEVTAHDGRRVRFPAEHLRPFVTHAGVSGEFVITFDAQHRFRSLQRVLPD